MNGAVVHATVQTKQDTAYQSYARAILKEMEFATADVIKKHRPATSKGNNLFAIKVSHARS